MINCRFEDAENVTNLRHVTADVVCLRNDGADMEVLMCKRAAHLVEGGKWGLPGGYMDLNETLVECARREFLEETGNTCTNMRLIDIDSRPDRDERQNVSAVFLVDPGERVSEPDHESTAVEWLKVDTVLQMPGIAFGHERYVASAISFKASGAQMPLLDGVPLGTI